MSNFERFNFKNKAELMGKVDELDLDVCWSDDVEVLNESVKVNNKKEIKNRLAIHPMEGCDAREEGKPEELTERRYINFAEGGAGLIWWEATSIVPEGKSNPNQLLLNKKNKDDFARLIETMNKKAITKNGYKPIHILQLNHSGRYSAPTGEKEPIFLFNDPYTDEKAGVKEKHSPVDDEYLKKLREEYVKAAEIANEAGFDGVDIKACHRYLLSEMLASYTRDGDYGGNYENRVSFIKDVIKSINSQLSELIIAVRINAYDGIPYPYGWGMRKDGRNEMDLSEPIRFTKSLADEGVDIFSISASDPRVNPHMVRPYNKPVEEGEAPNEHPLEGCARLFKLTHKIQKEIPDKIVLGAGYSWLGQFFPNIAAKNIKRGSATMVGVGRMAFAYPEFANDILQTKSLSKNKICVACSRCTDLMISGGPTGCVIRDRKVYFDKYNKIVK